MLREGEYRRTRKATAFVAAVGLAVGLGACSTGPRGSESSSDRRTTDSASAFPTPSATDTSRADLDLTNGPCHLFPYDDKTIKDEAAAKCKKALTSGKVVVVDFTGSLVDAKKATARLKEDIVGNTAGTVSLKYETVEASPAAKKYIYVSSDPRQSSPATCVDEGNAFQFSSFAAAKTMPELAGADFILAISEKEPCRDDTGGVADGVGGRLGEIFNRPHTAADKNKALLWGDIAAHEWGHLVKLGHAGFISGKDKDALYRSGLTLPTEKGSNSADLDAFLTDYAYSEYADSSNIMGARSDSDAVRFNPMQVDTLRWPDAQLQGDQVLRRKIMSNAWTAFSAKDVQEGRYAAVTLTVPKEVVEISQNPNDTAAEKISLDTVVFVPRLDNQTSNKIDSFMMYLTGIDSNKALVTAYMGDILPTNGNVLTLTYKTQKIFISGGKNPKIRVAA